MTRNNLPNNWQVKTLGEIVTDIRYGMTANADFINDGVKFLRVTDITENGSVDYSKLPHVVAKKNEAERYFLDNGDCIIARSGSVGKAHIFYGSEKIVFASYLIRLRFNKSIIHPSYFGAFSRTKSYWNQITSNTKGGVQQNINTEGLSRIQIPLPPLPIQKQIAEILEKADQARQKRKEANKLTDEFLQSVFIEMFGDPVKNPKGWEVQELNQIAEIDRDSVTNKSLLKSDLYIGLEHIEKDSGRLLRYESVDKIELMSNKFRFTSDHILYGKLRPYLNKVCLPKFNGVCSTDIIPIRPRKNISNKYFLSYLMRMDFFVKEATTKSAGANLPRISPNLLSKIKLYMPPLSLQQQFAEIVNKTEALKEKQKQSEQELENLFQSLMQKAFKGELVA